QERAYLGTDSRIFEPLAGALLAAVLTSDLVRSRAERIGSWLLVAGCIGLAWGVADLGGPGGATRGCADGGAGVVALRTAAGVAAIVSGERFASGALALPAIAYLGRLSYAMYLWHWPLQVWTSRYGWWDLSRVGTPVRVSILTALTVGLAALSYHLVEKP